MSGGSRPLRPSAFRSSAVKAIPLFNSGELSTASPRALVSSQPSPLCRRLVAGASSGITLCRMVIPPFHPCPRAAPYGVARRAMDHERITEGVLRPYGQRKPRPGPSVRAARSAADYSPWRGAPSLLQSRPLLLQHPPAAAYPPRRVALLLP